MAVLVEGISVIVRMDRINDTYPGGREGFESDCPNQTLIKEAILDEACIQWVQQHNLLINRRGICTKFPSVGLNSSHKLYI